MALPKDPVMLLSVVNTKLRDYYSNLEELAEAEDVTVEEIENKLKMINYIYDENQNKFVQKYRDGKGVNTCRQIVIFVHTTNMTKKTNAIIVR